MSLMNFLKNWSIQYQNKFTVDGVEKTIERVTGAVYVEGSDVDATVINEIQKHNVYKCDATRVIEGVNEIYDVSISGSDSFPVFDALIVVNFNETNTKDTQLLRLNGLNYTIRKATEFVDTNFDIGTLKGKYFGYIDIASSKFIVFDNINVSLLAKLESPTFTGAPTAPTAAAGTNTTQIATTAFATNQDLGVNQTWKDVAASRVSGTTYANTTGKPIMVSVQSGLVGGGYNVECYVNSILVAKSSVGAPGIFGAGLGMTFIVPSGATYSCVVNSIALWKELR